MRVNIIVTPPDLDCRTFRERVGCASAKTRH